MIFPTMLRRANGFLYFRKAIPEGCRSAMGGRKELLISLKTRDEELAKLRWRIVSAKVDAMLSAAKRGIRVPLASSLAKLTKGLDEAEREAFEHHLLSKLEADDVGDRPISHQQRAQFKAFFNAPPAGTATNPLLSVALAKREQEVSPTPKTAFIWNIALTRFKTLACDGADLPVREVTRQHLVKFKDALIRLPSIKGGTLSASSAKKYLDAVKSTLAYALAQGWLDANPATGLSIRGGATAGGKSDRLPYETTEARALLDAAAALPEGPNKFLPMILAYHGDHPSSRHRLVSSAFVNASHAARCVACHGVRSHPVPVALVGECSMPVV
jgi:Domain of unknown function (DUF6538)/Phage integrase SAM-like domain